jgi:hypothetical protein
MKHVLAAAVLATGLGGLCTSISAGSGGLDWMLGCWTSESGASREVWVRHSDQQLIGFAVAVKNGEIAFHEVLSIDVNDEGIHYNAHPQGQDATTFTASGAAGTEISFENPRHDYPQKVQYKREGNWLRATISSMDGSNPTSFDKMKCQ